MAESKPTGKNVPSTPPAPIQPPAAPPSASDLTPPYPGPGIASVPPPGPGPASAPSGAVPTIPAVKPDAMPSPYVAKPARSNNNWIMIAVVALLVLILVVLGFRSQRRGNPEDPAVAASSAENPELPNYSDFVARNKALIEQKYSEMILTDEPFAGGAPLAVRANGPLASAEGDPQLAALVDAFRIRAQVMYGSQTVVRDRMQNRVTRGDIRGFKVQALERIENGKVIFEEAQVTTPRNGLVKTAGRVLVAMHKTDLPGVMAEIRAAGMEFSPLPAPAGSKVFGGRLRFIGPWGKALSKELLISENVVGGLTLGVPVARLQSILPPTYGILKRKVLVNDSYYEVYKVTDQDGEPLFYVYEREGGVWGISIISASFKTSLGIGINNTLDQIRLHYPQVKLAYSGKKTPFVRVAGVDGIFIIQGDGDKKVISILIGESPEFE